MSCFRIIVIIYMLVYIIVYFGLVGALVYVRSFVRDDENKYVMKVKQAISSEEALLVRLLQGPGQHGLV